MTVSTYGDHAEDGQGDRSEDRRHQRLRVLRRRTARTSTPTARSAADANQAMGLAISNLTVGIALMKPWRADGGQLTGYKSFFALKATGNVALVGIDGFQASITNALVEINDASPITPGATPPPALNLHGDADHRGDRHRHAGRDPQHERPAALAPPAT